jgi:hypothetical protein
MSEEVQLVAKKNIDLVKIVDKFEDIFWQALM